MDEALQAVAEAYAARYGLTLAEVLGDGKDGTVWVLKSQTNPYDTAVKIHHDPAAYRQEAQCNELLREKRILIMNGFVTPRLVRADADLLALEMSIVSPPFLLDFASAYLDATPDFSEEIWEDWTADKAEQLG